MNIARLIGWLLLLFGAGLFTGEVYMILPFLVGWAIIYLYPSNSEKEVKNRFESKKWN